MLSEGDPDVEEDLLKARNCKLRLDLGGLCRDFVDSLQNGSARRNDVVTGAGLIPVAAVLKSS